MNGTGTKEDPYQVTTVDEFVEAIGSDRSYVKLMNDIDFNNSNYINLNNLAWKCIYFDGQNHKISNIYTDKGVCFKHSSPLSDYTATIENLIIEAVIINYTNNICCLFHVYSNCNFICNNCDFRIKLNNSNANVEGMFIYNNYSSATYSFTFNNCIFNIDHYLYDNVPRAILGDILNKTTYKSYYFNYCEFNLNLISMCTIDHIYNPTNSASQNFSLFSGSNTSHKMEFKYCPIFINIYNLGKNGCKLVQIYGTYGTFNLYNSYIIIQSKGKYPDVTIHMAKINCIGTCFYDKELSGDFIHNESSLAIDNLYGLTTAQCKDPEYLESIGFFIAY